MFFYVSTETGVTTPQPTIRPHLVLAKALALFSSGVNSEVGEKVKNELLMDCPTMLRHSRRQERIPRRRRWPAGKRDRMIRIEVGKRPRRNPAWTSATA